LESFLSWLILIDRGGILVDSFDFIKIEFGRMKFNFTIFNRLLFKISQLISLNQILVFIYDDLMLF